MKLLLPSTSVAVFALAACTTPAPVPLKEGDVPPAFTAPIAKDAPVWPQIDWWTTLNAPELPPLETTAKEQNLDLLAAAARVVQAQAQTGIAGSALFPSINATGTAQRRGTDQKGVPGGNTQNTFGVSAQASYEVDLWGRVRRGFESSRAEAQASLAAFQNIMLTLEGDLAQNYFSRISWIVSIVLL